MFNNIDTEHTITAITWWLNDLKTQNKLDPDFPLEAVLEARTIIMKNIIFEFGHYYFLQLLGTAMSTSIAVMWATIYFAYHEVHTLIPNHGYTRDSLMICLEYGHTMQQQTGQLSTMMLTTSVFSRGTLRINNPLLRSTTLI